MDKFVLDASVALAWLFKDEETPASMAVHAMTDDHQLVVPPHWFAEVANGIRQGERTNRCKPEDLPGFLHILNLLSFAVDTLAPFAQFSLVLPIAREHNLTIYDAAYLHCAVSNRLPLATFDRQLASVAKSIDVQVIGE
ncbi:type II toxin-antitoxin system VapC family toxin [Blastomonas sp.]|uniref:type II toxin-antitoxin system VapC family toxin n=1 Tax=Blastomonas sp. TaxID=1909299 RepID=UPI00391DEA16